MANQNNHAQVASIHAICTFTAPTNNADDTELSLVHFHAGIFDSQDAAWQTCKAHSQHPAFVSAYITWSLVDDSRYVGGAQ